MIINILLVLGIFVGVFVLVVRLRPSWLSGEGKEFGTSGASTPKRGKDEFDEAQVKIAREQIEARERELHLWPLPKQKFGNEPNSDGVAELIWQQEQTNKHLQKLISDFFWFRIGIIGLLIFGGISATGGFN